MAGFRGICCDICLDHVEFVIACSDKSSKFNSLACTLVVSDGVLDFHVFSGTFISLMNEGIIFREFLFSHFQFNSRNSRKCLLMQ